MSKLNEQLAFYRGIVSPEQDLAGVRIYKLDLFSKPGRIYQFRLTLLQPARQTADADGSLEIVFEGLQDDVFTRLPLGRVAKGDNILSHPA